MDPNGLTKHYSNNDITIVWKSAKCIHSGICTKGLPQVFRPKSRPWIEITAAKTQALIDQVNQCPSGALSYFVNEKEKAETSESLSLHTAIQVCINGPLLVKGFIEITHKDGRVEQREKVTALCRCGSSHNKPFCDGTHNKENFKDE